MAPNINFGKTPSEDSVPVISEHSERINKMETALQKFFQRLEKPYSAFSPEIE